MRKSVLVLLALFMAVCGCSPPSGEKQPPRAIKGVLDLSGWDFNSDGPVQLNGEWDLYWGRLLSDVEGTIPRDGYLELPATWKGHVLPDGRVLPAFGCATFHLKLIGPRARGPVMIHTPAIFSAYRLSFLDSRTKVVTTLAEAGRVGVSRSRYRPYLQSGQADVPGVAGDLFLQVSNFDQADRPGLWAPLPIGTQGQILSSIFRMRERDFFIIGAALIIGLYSLIIFALRRAEREPLWFGLFCLVMAAWFVSAGDYLSEYTAIGYTLNVRFNFLIPYALILTFLAYQAALFPRFYNHIVTRIILLLGLIQCLIVIIAPPAVFTRIMEYSSFYFAIPVLFVLYGLVRTMMSRRDAVLLLNLGGALILTLSGLKYAIDLRYSYINTTHYALQLGVFVLILFNAAAIAVLNARARRRSEELSERLNVEKSALAESEEKFRLIAETSLDCIFKLDTHGRITYVSPSISKIFGKEAEAYIDTDSVHLIAAEDHPRVRQAFRTLLEGGEVRAMEIAAHTADGRPVPLEISVLPVMKGGKTVTIQGAARDITARKRAEEERRDLEQQIQQGRKMEAIGLLAGGIAHDFNNILGSMICFAEMTHDGLPAGELRENVAAILAGCWRARDLVKQILTFSRVDKREKMSLRFDIIVKEALKLIRAALPSTIEIKKQIESGHHLIMADVTQIHQVIMNLCTNAGYAMREQGGVLGVEIKDVPVGEGNTMGLVPGEYASLTVTDTGDGIDPEHLGKIFEPFFTTKASGLGMGLAVAYGIVKGHNGAITVMSTPGQGARFTVFLPCARGGDGLLVQEEAYIPGGTECLLIVDDEPPILIAQKRLFESLGYQVTVCTDALRALAVFAHNPEAFDLVLTDMTMPGMTGKELAVKLLELRSAIPVVLCTGFSELIDEETAHQIGVRAVLQKPIGTGALARAIRRIIDEGASQ